MGSPVADVGVSYVDSLVSHDAQVLSKAGCISRLSVPYDIAYRLFVSLVSSCYNQFALACDMGPAQCIALRHAVISILVPKRSKWVCLESLYSLVTPGHLLSPDLFLNYCHLVEYILFIQNATSSQRARFLDLWDRTKNRKWGLYYRLKRG